MNTQQTLHQNQRYLVLGLGLTGFSVARYLTKHGYQCEVQDDRQQPPYLDQLNHEFSDVSVLTTTLADIDPHRFDCLVVSPGLSIRSEWMQQMARSGKRIIGDIELFAEAVDKPVLAITGSNGKSTVTSLLGEMIKADNRKVAVGGNIGVPALDLLETEADCYVLELSSFQLETTSSLKPLAAVVLNMSEDHMDRYDDLNDYQQTKQRIFKNAQVCISNRDDALTRCSDKDMTFSLQDPDADYVVTNNAHHHLCVEGESWISTDDIKLKGRHNWANCLAAMALANTLGISRQAIIKTLKQYTGLEHRSQWVAEINGVDWINDSKATNPGATQAAIEGLDNPVILIAGGQGKDADMSVLCDSLHQHVKTVLLIGEDAAMMSDSWQDCVEVEMAGDMPTAVKRAKEISNPGDIVLLSPACASFDQYRGFAQRGEHFSQLVRSLC